MCGRYTSTSTLADLAPSTGNTGEYISAAVLFVALVVQNNSTTRALIDRVIAGLQRRVVARD